MIGSQLVTSRAGKMPALVVENVHLHEDRHRLKELRINYDLTSAGRHHGWFPWFIGSTQADLLRRLTLQLKTVHTDRFRVGTDRY